MITTDEELAAVQSRIQIIQAMLAHARRTLTPESFQAQSKGWLREWERLETELREYLSTPSVVPPRETAGAA